jgi:hypothetical protein
MNNIINKTTLSIAGAAILALSILIGWNQHTKLTTARAELESSQVLYSFVVKEKQRVDSMINFYAHSVNRKDSIISTQSKENYKYINRIDSLEKHLAKVKNNVDSIKTDSSYAYLNTVMPKKAEQKYGFDSTQVKTIHRTFLERDELRNINLDYAFTTGSLVSSNMVLNSQITDLKSLVDSHIDRESILQKEKDACKAEQDGILKSNKQIKRQRNIVIGGVILTATIIIIKSIATK